MFSPKVRQALIAFRFRPEINRILLWDDPTTYSKKDLFLVLMKFLSCSTREMSDHVSSAIIDDWRNYPDAFILLNTRDQDITENITEYRRYLKELIIDMIETEFQSYKQYLDHIEKYEILF